MTPDALVQSILASLPEIVVVTGACVLLLAGLFVPEGRSHLLVAASLAMVAAAAAATLALSGETRPAYGGMFVVDRFAGFFKLLFYLATALTLLLSRRYVEDVGVFDPRYFLYYEDTDLSWRGQARGWRYRYVPDAIERHVHAATSIEGSDLFEFYVARNRLAISTAR